MSPIVPGTSPMAMVLEVVFLFVLLPLGAHFIIKALMRAWPWHARRICNDTPVCARCGYDLRGLELPRCPECGTLRGFRAPLGELGLSETEVREGFARTRARRAADPMGPTRRPPSQAPPPDTPPCDTRRAD